MAMTKAELQEKYDALVAEREGFIDNIVKVAGAAAYDHELCHVLEETFSTLGIAVPDFEVEVTRTETQKYALPGFEFYRLGLHLPDTNKVVAIQEALEYGDLSDYANGSTGEVGAVTVKAA